MKLLNLGFLLAFSGALCLRAEAQSYDYYSQVITNSMATSQLSQSIFNDMMSREMTREALKSSARGRKGGTTLPTGGGSTGSRKGGGGATVPGGATTFRPVAASLMPQRLASQLAKTPAQRQEFERFFSSLLESYKDILREKGAPQNDVARAASFAVANSFSVFHDGRLLSGEEVQGVREQVREAFAASAKFKTLTDQRKQELYEGYAIIGMFVSAVYDGASKRGDRKVISQMREMARNQLEETYGVPAHRLRFTTTGIEF